MAGLAGCCVDYGPSIFGAGKQSNTGQLIRRRFAEHHCRASVPDKLEGASLSWTALQTPKLYDVKVGNRVASSVVPKGGKPVTVTDHAVQLKVCPNCGLELPF